MSRRELERVAVMGRVGSGDLGLSSAAEMLELSYRQTKRLWRRYRETGSAGLKHGNAGRPSNRGRPGKLRRRVLQLITKKYSGGTGEPFGPTLAAEHLAEEDGIVLDHETLRRWMLEQGLWSRRRNSLYALGSRTFFVQGFEIEHRLAGIGAHIKIIEWTDHPRHGRVKNAGLQPKCGQALSLHILYGVGRDVGQQFAQLLPSLAAGDLGFVASQQQAEVVPQTPINRLLVVNLQNLGHGRAFWRAAQERILGPGERNSRD